MAQVAGQWRVIPSGAALLDATPLARQRQSANVGTVHQRRSETEGKKDFLITKPHQHSND